jgi:hypothetical protein
VFASWEKHRKLNNKTAGAGKSILWYFLSLLPPFHLTTGANRTDRDVPGIAQLDCH